MSVDQSVEIKKNSMPLNQRRIERKKREDYQKVAEMMNFNPMEIQDKVLD